MIQNINSTADCTFILLNYKRPDNFKLLVDSIKNQSLKSEIILIDNSPEGTNVEVDKKVCIPWNSGCFSRLFFLPYVKTDYVCFIDDDLTIKNHTSLETWINIYERVKSPIIGAWGATASLDGYNTRLINENHFYNILKGRQMLFHRNTLQAFSIDFKKIMNANLNVPEILKRADDIYFSFTVSKGNPVLYAGPEIRKELIDNLELSSTGLYADQIHKPVRSEFCKYLMGSI